MAAPNSPARILKVNCSWRKNTILITEDDNTPPLILAKHNVFTNKVVFKAGPSSGKALPDSASTSSADLDSETDNVFATSKIHTFHIGCDATIRGRPIKLTPAARLVAHYNYASLAYAQDPLKPALMAWRSNSVVRFFDHELRDERDALVARYNPRYTSIKHTAAIELFGPLAWDPRAVDEVVVTGLTLYLCMVYRASSPVPLVGALVTSTGRERKKQEKIVREESERERARLEGRVEHDLGKA